MDTGAVSSADLQAIIQTATEYFQSWFAGDAERMRSVLHPALAKRRVRDPSTGSLDLAEDPAEALIGETASGEGAAFHPRQDVTVLDAFRNMATVKVTSQPFVEYLHLSRFGEKWLIVNALYEWLDRNP